MVNNKTDLRVYDSTSNERTKNNTMRHQYRELTNEEKMRIGNIKELSFQLMELIQETPGRESSIAITNLETATMWAVKGITK